LKPTLLRRLNSNPLSPFEINMQKLNPLFLTICLAILLAMPVLANPECRVDSEIGAKLNLPVYEWKDDSAEHHATIVAVHGLTLYAQTYDSFAKHLAANGYPFYAADMRGFGRWKTEHAKFGGQDNKVHFTASKQDLVRLLEKLREEQPDKKIICLGESLGANLVVWLASERPELLDGAILSAPCFSEHVTPTPRWAVDIARALANPKTPFDLSHHMKRKLSDDPSVTEDCLKDERMTRALTPVEFFKAMKTNRDSLKKVAQIKPTLPILVIAGSQDKIFKAKSIPKTVAKFGSKQVAVKILDGKGHLLIEHQEVNPQIASIVDGWLTDNQNEQRLVQAQPIP
jgi:alpha-beta hydrolase superfamily lysophospholipase